MDPRRDVHVLAALGDQPGVLTELLWYLVVRRADRVARVEIHTTTHGATALQTKGHLFDKLRHALGDLADAVPWPGEAQFEVRMLVGPEGPLDDIRHDVDARLVDQVLHDRVRELRAVPQRVVGLLGGRKTMGTALHTAFTLHGRPEDELLHVLVRPDIERSPQIREYACPDPAFGLLDDQVTVHAVPFASLRLLLRRSRDLMDRLDSAPYLELRDAIRLLGSGVTGVALVPHGQSWDVEIGTRAGPVQVGLPKIPGRIYRALCDAPDGLTEEELEQALQRLGPLDDPRQPASLKRRISDIVSAVDLHPELEAFVPRRVGEDRWLIPGARRVIRRE
jgi:CRISPR-associated protein (TIGR02584 family)